MTELHSDKASAIHGLITEARDLTQVDAGLSLAKWTSAMELAIELYGTADSTTLFCERKVAKALMKVSRHREALLILLRHFVDTSHVPPKTMKAALYARQIGFCLNHLERHTDALKLLNIAKEIFEETLPPDNPELLRLKGSVDWTRQRIEETQREQNRCERMRLERLALRSKRNIALLKRCRLAHEKHMQVLERLLQTYAVAEEANNLRVMVKPSASKLRPSQRDRLQQYEQAKTSGIGTAYDEEFVAKGKDGDDVVVMFGYNVP